MDARPVGARQIKLAADDRLESRPHALARLLKRCGERVKIGKADSRRNAAAARGWDTSRALFDQYDRSPAHT